MSQFVENTKDSDVTFSTLIQPDFTVTDLDIVDHEVR